MPFIPFTTQFCQIMSLLVVHFCAMPTLEMYFSSIHWSVWNGFLSSRVRKQNVWHFQTQDHYKHLSESETSCSNALNLKKTKNKNNKKQKGISSNLTAKLWFAQNCTTKLTAWQGYGWGLSWICWSSQEFHVEVLQRWGEPALLEGGSGRHRRSVL